LDLGKADGAFVEQPFHRRHDDRFDARGHSQTDSTRRAVRPCVRFRELPCGRPAGFRQVTAGRRPCHHRAPMAGRLIAMMILAATDMVAVPAGPFLYGSDDGDADERPRRQAATSAFLIDRTEVTRAAYGRCVAAGACSPAASYPDQTDPSLPPTGVSFHDAVRYCRCAGKRLPTELEWEKAARGTDGRTFPWGDRADCSRANYGSWMGEGPCGAVHPGRPEPVGRYPQGASPYGAPGLAGNVGEWV